MGHYSVVAVTPTTDARILDHLSTVGLLVERHGSTCLAAAQAIASVKE